MTRAYAILCWTALVLVAGCERRLVLIDTAASATDAGVQNDAEPPPDADAAVVSCAGGSCPACANGLDDDRDGLIDGFDPECSGAFDEDESSFATGLHTDNPNRKFSDCFFDGDSGKNDGCALPACCAEPDATGCGDCTVSDKCLSSCLPRVPNGCDCFGCCEVRSAGVVTTIVLRDGCSLASLDDAQACPRCTLNRSCLNECAECELCAGKTPAQLSPACGGSDSFVCETSAVCSADEVCGLGEYCAQGCCLPPLL